MSSESKLNIREAFEGAPPIGIVIDNWFSRPASGAQATTNLGLVVHLGYAVGTLTRENICDLTEDQIVMIQAVTLSVRKLVPEDRTWYRMLMFMDSHPMTRIWEGDTRVIPSTPYEFKHPGRAELAPEEIEDISRWYEALTFKHAKEATLLPDTLGKILERVNTTINSLLRRRSRETSYRILVMDVNVLQYPDPNQPHFYLYTLRIHLNVFIVRWLWYFKREVSATLEGDFRRVYYQPHETSIATVPEEARHSLVDRAVGLLDGIL